jgi:hypothetical protein
MRDHVFNKQLFLFKTLQEQLIPVRVLIERGNFLIERSMLLLKLQNLASQIDLRSYIFRFRLIRIIGIGHLLRYSRSPHNRQPLPLQLQI